jgi:AcrR family transcriptional regulator
VSGSTTEMPQRRRLPRKEREDLMLRAAGRAFAARGFHAASMDVIAADAGVSKPMLYRYFGSKKGLYAAYVRSSGRELVEGVRAPETRDEPPEVRLRAGIRAFLGYVEARRAGWTVLHGETTAPTHAAIAREVAELRGRIIRMLVALFDDEAFAHAFAGAAESLATWWAAQPQRSVEDATEVLLRIAAPALPSRPRSTGRGANRGG